jgi:hypothetical protein
MPHVEAQYGAEPAPNGPIITAFVMQPEALPIYCEEYQKLVGFKHADELHPNKAGPSG